MTGTDDVGELRRFAAARLIGAAVERVHVPLDGGGRFGLRMRVRGRDAAGAPWIGLRWLSVPAVAWRLDLMDTAADPDAVAAVLAACGDREARLAADLAVLAGREISALHVDLPGWDTRIHFGDLRLKIFPVYHREPLAVPDWAFRLPSGRLLVVGPGPRWAVRT